MRIIKFRGRDRWNGVWYYGSLFVKEISGRTHIFATAIECYEVDPETVGQFTGLMDKNGAEIYEGDIVEWEKDNRKYVVKFWEGMFYASVKEYNDDIFGGFPLHAFTQGDEGYRCEIVGNIHDNTELPKGGEQ